MPTLQQFRARMLAIDPTLGRVETISAVAAQTLTVPTLAVGTVGARKMTTKWLLRNVATAAIRNPRLTSNYVSATGVLTHAGVAYSDTSTTSGTVEIHEYEPTLLEQAIQDALDTLRRVDRCEMQSRLDGIYTFENYSWIAQPQDIKRIGRSESPILTGNAKMDQWGTVSSGGVLQPDRWTLAGASATFGRSTTSRGRYSLSVQRAGTNATVAQTVKAVTAQSTQQSLRTQVVTGVGVFQSTVASEIRVRVTSESVSGTVLSTSNSGYHTGGGSWEELSIAHTVDAAADIIRVQAINEVDGTALVDELYLMAGAVNEGVRLGRFTVNWDKFPKWDQNPMTWKGAQAVGGCVAFDSRRPYPTFDATRVKAGSADDDVSDAPLDLVAYKALALFYERQSRGHASSAALMAKSASYMEKAENLALGHLADPQEAEAGESLITGRERGYAAVTL